MILFLLAYLGGVLTIVSPCILPVLPFVFARADRPFLRSGLPMLLGMAVTFAVRRDAGRRRRRLGGAGQPIRALRGDRPAGAVRRDAAVSRACRPVDAAAGRARRAAVAVRPDGSENAGCVDGPRCCSASPPACSGRRAPDRSSA